MRLTSQNSPADAGVFPYYIHAAVPLQEKHAGIVPPGYGSTYGSTATVTAHTVSAAPAMRELLMYRSDGSSA